MWRIRLSLGFTSSEKQSLQHNRLAAVWVGLNSNRDYEDKYRDLNEFAKIILYIMHPEAKANEEKAEKDIENEERLKKAGIHPEQRRGTSLTEIIRKKILKKRPKNAKKKTF